MQVDSLCPLCGIHLFFKKGNKDIKLFEIAHIYPHSPNNEQITILENKEHLGKGDSEHIDNLIPLCPSCHTKYDSNTSLDDYHNLVRIKKSLIFKQQQWSIWGKYQLESDIVKIIQALCSINLNDESAEISWDAVSVANKFDGTLTPILERKVKHYITDYFLFVRSRFKEMSNEVPAAPELIATQVKACYLEQKKMGMNQQDIFNCIVEWIKKKTQHNSQEAAEIITSFFIQNCEVFDDCAK